MKITPYERAALRGLMALPAAVVDKMAQAVETVSRHHLDPRLRMLLALSGAHKPMNVLRLEQARAAYSEMIALLDVPRQSVAKISDHQVPVAAGEILLRRYQPKKASRPAAAIMFCHGGGFTVGSVDDYERICRFIANRTGAVVLSVGYRLGPEFPAPTAAEDCLAAWAWVHSHCEQLGLDADRIAVMGDSAGGNLSAVVCQQAALQGLPLPAVQVLMYPTTDAEMTHPSITTLGQGFGLDYPLLRWFVSHYVVDPALIDDIRVSPLRNPDLQGQPPAILVTATDPLRDEGLEYGSKLRQAGVTVIAQDHPELVHGFLTMGGVIPSARQAVEQTCDTLVGLL